MFRFVNTQVPFVPIKFIAIYVRAGLKTDNPYNPAVLVPDSGH